MYDRLRLGGTSRSIRPASSTASSATFLVDLDVPADQVIGATGVPVCGDPGWERANRNPKLRRSSTSATIYGASTPPSDAVRRGEGSGRKKIRWYAEKVHHFAMSLNPDYRYEGGHFGNVAVHVLYQPGDEKELGRRRRRWSAPQAALAWLDQLYGPFGWPQITQRAPDRGRRHRVPHDDPRRLGRSGTHRARARPQLYDGTPRQQRVARGMAGRGLHQLSDDVVLGGDGPAGRLRQRPRPTCSSSTSTDSRSRPSLVGEAYRDFTSYNIAIYSRGELFFHQLRYIVGDETMHRILRTFYERWKFHHVDEAAFRAVAEEVSGQDLSALFAQWLHGTDLYDYAVGRVKTRRIPSTKEGTPGWVTRVEVKRKAPGRIPVEVAVIGQGDTALARTEGLADREWVEIETRTRPREVLVDPRVRTHDWNMLNNRKQLGFKSVAAHRARARERDLLSSLLQHTQPTRPADCGISAHGLVQRRRRRDARHTAAR